MNRWALALMSMVLVLPLWAQQTIPRARTTQQTANFILESDLNATENGLLVTQLDGAMQLFGEYFGAAKPTWPLRVRVFASYDAYLATLATFPAEFNLRGRQDFLFLYNAKNPETSVLLMYLRDDASLMDASLVKNLFLHYVFALSPTMSPWLREGLALYFELARRNEVGTLELRDNHLYLDRLALVRQEHSLTLEQLQLMDNEAFELQLESAFAHSWAVVNYLALNHKDSLLNIIAREVSGDTSTAHNELLGLTSEIESYFNHPGLNQLLLEGRSAIAAEQYELAFTIFEQAHAVNPTLWSALYYQGLASFHLQNFDEAVLLYNLALELGAQEALIYYALGMVALEREDFGQAESYFTLAETADLQRFGRHVAEQRRKMEARRLLQ